MNYADAIAHAERLLERALELGALRYGDFTLTSGAKSSYYFDGRLLTTDGESVEIVASIFLKVLENRNIHHFGGPAVAAVPIIGGIALMAHTNGYDLKGYFVRSEQKQHGMGKQIEGHITPGDRVAIWDDTISTGGSLLDAVDAVAALPTNIDIALCILDRNQGGSDKLRARDIPLFNILTSNSEGRVEVDSNTLTKWFNPIW